MALRDWGPRNINMDRTNLMWVVVLMLMAGWCLYATYRYYRILHQKGVAPPGDPETTETSAGADEAADKDTMPHVPALTSNEARDRALFARFEQEVKNRLLYLDYQLGRDYYKNLLGVSKNHFAYLMRHYGKTNLNGYLNNLRLEEAARLLRECPELPVSDVGIQCALPSTSTFFRLFKEKYGVSPAEYRKQAHRAR